MTVGGDTCRFLMGEINGQAWLGAHNAALNSWNDFYINPDGGFKVGIGDLGGGSGNVAVPILTVDNANGVSTFAGRITANVGISYGTFTVGTFPSTTYLEAVVTDALAPVIGATVAAGGSAKCKVMYNGSAKIVTAVL
jgi:hypothetical protein